MFDELIKFAEKKVAERDKEKMMELDKELIIDKYINLKLNYIKLCADLTSVIEIVNTNKDLLDFDNLFGIVEENEQEKK